MSSSQPETVFEDEDHRILSRHAGIQPISLQKGLKVKLQQDGTAGDFSVGDWHYDASDPTAPVLHVIVRKTPKPRFDTLPTGVQDIVQTFFVLVLLTIVGVVSYVVYVHNNQPVLFWGYVGKYLRWSVFALIVLVGFGLIARVEGYVHKGKRTFSGVFLGLSYTLITMLLAGYWLYISDPPTSLEVFPADYADYVTYIRSRVQTNVVVPLASLAWLFAILKIIGWGRLVSIVETGLGIFKGKGR